MSLRDRISLKGVSFWTTLIIGLVAIIAVFIYVIAWPVPDKTVATDKTIEIAAGQMGIQLRDKAYLENKFVEGVALGGAGGQGAPQMGEKSSEKFLEQLKINENWPLLKTVYIAYSFETVHVNRKETVARKYWPVSTSGFALIDEFYEYYPIPGGYILKEANSQEVVFVKDEGAYTFDAIAAAIATALLYFWLVFSRLAKLIEWLLNNISKTTGKTRNPVV